MTSADNTHAPCLIDDNATIVEHLLIDAHERFNKLLMIGESPEFAQAQAARELAHRLHYLWGMCQVTTEQRAAVSEQFARETWAPMHRLSLAPWRARQVGRRRVARCELK